MYFNILILLYILNYNFGQTNMDDKLWIEFCGEYLLDQMFGNTLGASRTIDLRLAV